jgi:predicted Zn-dependent protease
MKSTVAACAIVLACAAPAFAQFGGVMGGLQKAKEAKDTIDQIVFTEAEEVQLGQNVSTMLRKKYGVAQDPAVHKYVALVGTVLAQASTRPNLKWTFIVLDTDGVNAFAAPGGFIHVTRGALALMHNEAELAGVLGHEISHVTEKHTVNAIRKNKLVQVGASAARSDILQQVADRTYEILLENKYDRKDEMDADEKGVVLANKAGYAPAGLGTFLTDLSARNKDLKEPSGLFASHPETKARLDALVKVVGAQKPAATAMVAPRYEQSVPFKPVPVAQVAPGSAGKLGLTGSSPLGQEKASNQTVSSAGSRGVNPDRDAKGGSNSTLVPVTLTAAEVTAFRKGIV